MSKNYKQMNKGELIKLLVDDYGYTRDDLKEEDGRLFTNPKLKSIISQEVEDEELFSTDGGIKADRKEYKDTDLIEVMNGLSGSLTHRSERLNRVWRFKKFGVVQKLPYSEIIHINNNNHKAFEEGWLIILDNQLVNELDLDNVYINSLTPENIEEVFNKDVDDIEILLKSMPYGARQTFFSVAREKYHNKEIDSINLVELIEKEFNISLETNTPLNEVVKGS